MKVNVPISPGELLDKLSILQIKSDRIADSGKRENVERELALLDQAWHALNAENDDIRTLRAELKAVNEQLWDIENAIREKEAQSDFGPAFIELARAVYQRNDERARIKWRLNEVLGSELVEEKSYSKPE